MAIQLNPEKPILRYGERLEPFAMRPLELDKRMNLLVGSIRSGKTWALHPKILRAGFYPVPGMRVMTGVTKDTVYDNVLSDIFNLIGRKRYTYNHQSGLLRICGQMWRVIGAKDEGSEAFIRGKTIGVAVCDELTLMPESFFKMLWTRMSPEGARLYGTTNTDTPLHYLKKNYIDLMDIPQPEGMKGLIDHLQCTMDDNPNLSPEYIASQKSGYKGLFYERFILGRWVMAAGVIYRDSWRADTCYDEGQQPIGLYGAGGTKQRTIVIDYGTVNDFVAHDYRDDGTIHWCDDELRWDSRTEMRQKTDAEYGADLEKWLKGDHGPRIVIDPSAASMKAELLKRHFWVVDAKNDVPSGIQKTSTALARGMIRFHRIRCAPTIAEFQTYAWDEKKALRGIEEPIKSGDHGPDCTRYYVNTIIPAWRLML